MGRRTAPMERRSAEFDQRACRMKSRDAGWRHGTSAELPEGLIYFFSAVPQLRTMEMGDDTVSSAITFIMKRPSGATA
jgi:hypothetical protein